MPAQLMVFNGLPFVRPLPSQSFVNVFPPPGCTLFVSSYTPLPACRSAVAVNSTHKSAKCRVQASMDQAPATAHGRKQQATITAKGGLPQPARTLQSPSLFAQKVTMHLLGSSDRTHIHMGESSLSCMLHGSASSPQQSLRHAAPRTSPHTPARPSGDVPVCLPGAVVVVVTARVVVVVVAVTVVVSALHASAGRCRHHHTEANESKRDVLSQHQAPGHKNTGMKTNCREPQKHINVTRTPRHKLPHRTR